MRARRRSCDRARRFEHHACSEAGTIEPKLETVAMFAPLFFAFGLIL